jgi:hypothetical protein
MATTVDIIIKGIAICYRKDDNWHVLFPIDAEECHKIAFSYKKGDNSDLPKGDLAKSTAINITIAGAGASSVTSETSNFTSHVLDLTSQRTHGKIRSKGDLTGKAVLLTIPHARFSINKYLEEFPSGRIPDLVETKTGARNPIYTLAHSVKGTITLNDGAQVVVESDGLGGGRFVTEPGFSSILTFNNDCEKPKPGKNDMDMFYEVIEEFDPSTGSRLDRQFRIGDVGSRSVSADEKSIKRLHELGLEEEIIEKILVSEVDIEIIVHLLSSGLDREAIQQLIQIIILSEPPNFTQGKPCLVVKVSDQESIRTLP